MRHEHPGYAACTSLKNSLVHFLAHAPARVKDCLRFERVAGRSSAGDGAMDGPLCSGASDEAVCSSSCRPARGEGLDEATHAPTRNFADSAEAARTGMCAQQAGR